jgi:hypothetical protein
MKILRLVVGFIVVLVAAQPVAGQSGELDKAKTEYAKAEQTEAARVSFVTKLIRMRARFAQTNNEQWKAVDAEVMHHPAPADSAVLSKRLVGEWASPRHEYVFKSDGTWSMLPVEPDVTHGTWRIEGNLYFDTDPSGHTTKYTVLLLTATDFVFTDGEVVFYETRIGKSKD